MKPIYIAVCVIIIIILVSILLYFVFRQKEEIPTNDPSNKIPDKISELKLNSKNKQIIPHAHK